MKGIYYSFFAVCGVCLVVAAMAFVNAKDKYPDKHLEIVLRNIGHQLLLHSGDSTSRVLPVTVADDNTFRISFENSLVFTPDTLMKLVYQQLATTDMPKNYIVNVKECLKNQTIFAYEVKPSTGNLQPCRGRLQKRGCYVIEISFFTKKANNYVWLLLPVIPLAFLGVFVFRNRNQPVPGNDSAMAENRISEPKTQSLNPEVNGQKMIGSFLFDEVKGTLHLGDQTIELSEKEAKAIVIFASNQNMMVERDLFRKTIWEDDGVVVIPRNVDVLISKLRKKLSADPAIRIVNVHGRGYKLVTG